MPNDLLTDFLLPKKTFLLSGFCGTLVCLTACLVLFGKLFGTNNCIFLQALEMLLTFFRFWDFLYFTSLLSLRVNTAAEAKRKSLKGGQEMETERQKLRHSTRRPSYFLFPFTVIPLSRSLSGLAYNSYNNNGAGENKTCERLPQTL